MKFYYKSFLAALAIFLISTSVSPAQSFDYEQKPVFKYDFVETDINLNIDTKKAAVQGSATYLLKANITGADSLVLHAPGIAVDSVLTGNKALNYNIKNDRLFIALNDSTVAGKQFRVQIFYHANPRFGFLKSSEGTIWTSMLPKAHRHWIPSPDHPRAESIVTLTMSVPASYAVAATGVKTNEEILGLDRKKVTFRSSKPVPVTSLAFAVGKLNAEGASFGIKRVVTYAEPGTIRPSLQNKLAGKAKKIISEIERVTNMEYPYQRVHVVILNDHFWEQKPYGASVIYLYQNRGELLNQLRRGLYAQWFGVYQHEAQWADSVPIQLFQTALHYNIADEAIYLKSKAVPKTNFSTVYDMYSVNRWNFWQKISQWNNGSTQKIASGIIPELLARGSGTFTQQRYESVWYRLSGQPNMDIPEFRNGEEQVSDSQVVYRVDIQPSADSLKVIFTAEGQPVEAPRTVSLKVVQGGSAVVHNISFGGRSDVFIMPISGGIQNVLLLSNNENIQFNIHKPVPYVLYQLKNAESVALRKKAALQLGYHTENPDLQLVITGYLNQKMEPAVKAALLRSYAAITAGASGTQQYFIEALGSPHAAVRKAALEGIQNFPEDSQITKQIRNIIEQSEMVDETLLAIYMQRVDSTRATGFVRTLVQQDTAGTKAIQAIAALAASGQTEQAVKLANFYIQPVYAYPVRKKALFVLLKYDDSARRWKERIQMLLTDLDPRIRYLTVQHLARIPGVNRGEVLQQYIPEAYDARIYKAVNKF